MSSVRRVFPINGISWKCKGKRPALLSINFERSISRKIWPFDFSRTNLNRLEYAKSKFDVVMKSYENYTGFSELKVAQQKVEEAAQKLSSMQEERCNAFVDLLQIQNRLKGVYSQLENTKRGDERYIQLITEEHSLLQQEKMQQEKFKAVEKAERDQFTLFIHLVKNAHDKERLQSQKTKYWSIIGSVCGTLLGIVGSTINTYRKQSELKKLIAESSNTNLESQLNKFIKAHAEVEDIRYKLKNEVNVKNKLLDDMLNGKTDENNSQMHKYLDELILKTNTILLNIDETVKLMNSMPMFEIYRIQSSKEEGPDLFFVNLNSFLKNIQSENRDFQSAMFGMFFVFIGVQFVLKIITNALF